MLTLQIMLAFPLFPTEPQPGARWGVGTGWGEPAEFHFGTPVPRLRVYSPGPRVPSPAQVLMHRLLLESQCKEIPRIYDAASFV
ncbi:Kelch Domain-Containing Protein 7A [Manis pentadactyla]|nr:Kelch Domain-Containing Protein 7A [Manis pentadactyla]